MKNKKFLRRDAKRFKKFGNGKGKKGKWRNPTGRDNKMREKRKGYPKTVSIGYKNKDSKKEKLVIKNAKDLENHKGKRLILGRIGKKKKEEIAKKAVELKVKFENFNSSQFLKKLEKINEKKKKEKEKLQAKKEGNEDKK